MAVTPSELEFAYRLMLGRPPNPWEIERNIGADIEILRRRLAGHSNAPSGPAAARPGGKPAIVHLHIPKSAGTSLNAILDESYPGEGRSMSVADNELDKLRALDGPGRRALSVIHGHLSHGVGQLMPQGALYISILRQPRPRVFSFYKFIRRSRRHPLHKVLRARDVSFGAFLELAMERPNLRIEVDNGQMRRLAGMRGRDSVQRNPAVLRKALANLFAPDMLFGLTETFDAFLQRLRDAALIAPEANARLNVSPEPVDLHAVEDELTQEQRRLFDDFVSWDSCLYDIGATYDCKLNRKAPAP